VLGVTWNYGPQELVGPDGIAAENLHDAALIYALDDLIGILRAADKRIILIGPIAEPGYDIASDLSRNLAFGHVVTEPMTITVDKFRQQYGASLRISRREKTWFLSVQMQFNAVAPRAAT
jgi:hypothetical protein